MTRTLPRPLSEPGQRSATQAQLAGVDLGFTGRAARAAALRPWRAIAVWAVLMSLAVAVAGSLGDALTDDGATLVEVESETAAELIAVADAALGVPQVPTEFVLVESRREITTADGALDEQLVALTDELRGVAGVVSVLGPTDGVPGLVSADGSVALLRVEMVSDELEDARALVDVVAAADAATTDFRIVTVGDGSIGVEFSRLAEETLLRAELLGVPIALVILVLVFGAVVAALVPMGLALVSIGLAIGITALVGRLTDLDFFVTNMITMIGLAVGIDYSLFIVQRYREERQGGRAKTDAIIAAGATATRAVFFSGMTVVIALTGMMFVPQVTMRSLGLGAIVAVFASVLAAVTLLPAVLSLLGDRVNRLRVPGMHRDTDTSHAFWRRITGLVTARPVVSVILAGGLLLTAASPYLGIRLGSNFIESLPESSDSRYGFELLNDRFRGGLVTAPIVIEADDVSAPGVASATAELVAALESDPAYANVAPTAVPEEGLIVVRANALLDPSTVEARTALETLREETIPAAFAATDATVYVGGDAALMADFVELVSGRTPAVFAFVLTLSFLLLTVAFRSLVVPLKAIVMNLLSVGAAYGLVVLVFQHGFAAGLLGFQQTDVIEAWVPLFLFAVLFGLSMDYHVFLLSRIREHYVASGDNSQSVAHGLSVTGAIITGAALIMVAVFGGFAAGGLVMFQQMGFGLAAAVILDATIVRSVLVPATMELLGDANWYFPRWLEWLPKLNIEGPPLPSPPSPPAG